MTAPARQILRPDVVRTGAAGGTERRVGVEVVLQQGLVEAIRPVQEHLRDGDVVDLPGCALMPGMIDAHVHLGFPGADEAQPLGRAEETAGHLLLRMAENARQLVSVGVTTARDLGCADFLDVVLRDAVEEGLVVGPHLRVATRPVTPVGGHCWFLGGEADGPDDVRRVVADNIRGGADWIKLMATGGSMTPTGAAMWEPTYDLATMRAAVEEAHERGRPVAAHAHGAEGIARASAAKVDTIEHCSFIGPGGFMEPAPADPRLIDDIAESGVLICPTVSGVIWHMADRFGPGWLDGYLARLADLRSRGVRMVAGTDAGFVTGGGYVGTMDRYVEGLRVFAEAGWSNTEVLEAATSLAARACGVGDRAGMIRAGWPADLIAVEGDPLSDVGVLAHVRSTWVGGRRVSQRDVETTVEPVG